MDPETIQFDEVRRQFEALIDLPPDERRRQLAAMPRAQAREVAELLGIVDEEKREDARTRVLDAHGRGLVLLRDERTVWKLFRVEAERLDVVRSELARWPELVGRLAERAAVVPVTATGLEPAGTGWFATEWIDGARDLPSIWPGLTVEQRATHATSLREVLAAAEQAGIARPWPGPRQLLLDGEDRLRVLDLGLTHRLALEPETGQVVSDDVARDRLAPYLDPDG